VYQFKYHKPDTVEEAVALFNELEDPFYLSGGQTLIPTLKQRLAAPSDLIDLSGIAALRGIRQTLPVLASLAEQIGDAQVRNLGTIGGSLANSDPAADYPAAVIGLGATIHTQKRTIAADDYFHDLFETALEPGEVIARIDFPVPDRAAYRKFPNPASRYAVAGVLIADFGGSIRVGITGAGPCAFRATAIEEVLSRNLNPAALAEIEVPDAGFNSDLHASAEYRAHLVKVMAERAVADLLAG
jgi:carbon-monoxide dehydrogenase medium subunit